MHHYGILTFWLCIPLYVPEIATILTDTWDCSLVHNVYFSKNNCPKEKMSFCWWWLTAERSIIQWILNLPPSNGKSNRSFKYFDQL